MKINMNKPENVIKLVQFLSTVLFIYFIVIGNYDLAIISMMWKIFIEVKSERFIKEESE